MIKLNWRWIAAVTCMYLILLTAYLPAAQVVNRLPLPASVRIGEVSGTIWQGRIDRLTVNNLPIQNVHWQLSALPLLVGNVSANVQAGNMRKSQAIAFKGPLTFDLLSQDSLSATDFLVYVPVDRVLAEIQLPLPVNAGGRFRVNIESLDVTKGQCSHMMAYGDWLNASVAGTQGPIELGNFSAKLKCESNAIFIAVAEPNAFGLTLDVEMASDLSSFNIESTFKPDASLPQEVHDAARFFGQPDSEGYFHYRIQ